MKIDKRIVSALIIASCIILIATVVRLINLTKLPVFADEAIYVRWSQVMRAEPTLRFLPLSDGKEPLFMWIVIPFFKLFDNPLFAGRIVSVLSGAGTMVGVVALSYLLFKSKKAALLSLVLYAVSPFSFFFHRMALVDALLSMFGLWVAIGGVAIAKWQRLDLSMLTGFALGGAWLTKSPALFFALMLPSSVVLTKKVTIRSIVLTLFLVSISIGMGYAFYNILRLGPNFHLIGSRNLDYVLPYSHILTNPRDPFIFHLDRALEWIWILGPAPILVLAMTGSVAFLKRYPREIFYLLVLFAFPLLVASMYAKVFTARYIFFTLPPLFVIAGLPILLRNNLYLKGVYVVLALFVFLSARNIYPLITNPANAQLPESERSGYLVEWTAGDGLAEIAQHVRADLVARPDQKIVIGTEGYFGTLPDGLQMYLEKVPNVTIYGTGLNFTEVPSSLIDAKKAGHKVYFVANKSRLNLKNDFSEYGLVVVAQYDKALRSTDTREYVQKGPQETLYFFEVQSIVE